MKHSQETRNQALNLYRSGLSVNETATELGLRVGTVGGWVKSAGIARAQGARLGPRSDKSLRRPALDDLYSAEEPLAVVARRHGISESTLRNWRQEDDQHDVAFTGKWVRDGLIMRPSAA